MNVLPRVIPAAVSQIVRMSAGALLLAEKKTTVELRRQVDDASKMVSGELASQHDKNKNALLLVLLLASHRLKGQLETSLQAAKRRSREVGARRLQVELRSVGAAEAAARVNLKTRVVTDIQASTSAESLAIAWRQKAIYEATKAAREGRSIAEALARLDIDGNVSRTGTTESAQAYNEGHVEASIGLDVEGLIDRWEAMLDSCPRCYILDGSTTAVGEPFPSGEEPALVHVRCRCMRTTVAIPRK